MKINNMLLIMITYFLQLMDFYKQRGEKTLLERREKLILELIKLRHRVDEFNDFGELDMMQQYIKDGAAVQKRLNEARTQVTWINKVGSSPFDV